MTDSQLLAIAATLLAYAWLAFQLGRFHERDRATLRSRTAQHRTDTERFARVVGSAVETPRAARVIRIDEARGLRTKGVA